MPPQPSKPTPLEVFYSYARKDERLRAKLDNHLGLMQRQGLITDWHDRMIEAGDDWESEINAHLNSAHLILLLISDDFIASDYCYSVEMQRALEREARGEARVIPIILRPVDWESGPFAKLQALPTKGKPVTEWRNRDAAFKDIAQGLRKIIKSFQPKPEQHPTSANIPRPPAVGFVSRRDEQGRDILERLREELAPGRGRLVALWGPGGSGKSTLAAEVARALRPAYNDRLAWVSALGRADFSLSTLLDDIATQLGSPELRTLAPAPKQEQVRALVSASPALVVLDNFETIRPEEQTACAAFLAACGDCPALITTRNDVSRDDIINLRLAAMEPDEAHEFLRRLVEQSARPSAFVGLDLDELIRECEANPLVIQWIVGQIVKARRPQDVLDEIKGGSGDAAERVFDRSFDLPQLGDDGRAALLALSLFTPSASREALAATAGFGNDLRRLDKAAASLSSLWLVETTEGNERLLLRGLTRQLAKSRLARDGRAASFRHRFATYFLAYARTHRQKAAEDFDALEAEKDNLLGALDIAVGQRDWLTVIGIRVAMNEFLDLRGYWVEAIRTGEQAIQAAHSFPDESMVAVLLNDVGVIYQSRGELTEARRVYGESLEIKKRLGSQRGIAVTLHELGRLAQSLGEVEEARRLYGESLEISNKFGLQNGAARTLHQLGKLAAEQGDVKEARRLFTESLEIERRLGDESGISISLHALANLAGVEGELREARLLYEESLEITKKLGDKSNLALIFYNMGHLAEKEGNKTEAARLLKDAVDIFEELGSRYVEMASRDLERVTEGST